MAQPLKQIIKKTPLYTPLRTLNRLVRKWIVKRRQMKELAEWKRQGKPVPPPHIVKQRTLRTYAKEFGLKVLVETGTFKGAMIEAMKDSFDYIYSIELGEELYEKAKRRFDGASHIELIHGDSGVELRKVINRLDQPALFWLDGHYSGGVTARGGKGTPIYEEMSHLLDASESGHVVIIDDARCFGTDPAYPSLGEFCDLIRSRRPNVDVVVQDDSIRITPKP